MTQKQQDKRSKKAWDKMIKAKEKENKRYAKTMERILAVYCRTK